MILLGSAVDLKAVVGPIVDDSTNSVHSPSGGLTICVRDEIEQMLSANRHREMPSLSSMYPCFFKSMFYAEWF